MPSTSKQFTIQSLLNPAVTERALREHTEASSSTSSSSSYTMAKTRAQSASSNSTSALRGVPKRQKVKNSVKNSVKPLQTERGQATAQVKYKPFELAEIKGNLTRAEQRELHVQFKKYNVTLKPANVESADRIQDWPQRYPFKTTTKLDKNGEPAKNMRTLYEVAGKTAVDAWEYTLTEPVNPNEPNKNLKGFKVLWDYELGLVRLTPFFKLHEGFFKSLPSDALKASPGLFELRVSVTGGTTDSQGFYLNYRSARALCATFCYEIRYLLTPIFGPQFIHDCLTKDHPDFKKYQVDRKIIKHDQKEQKHWLEERLQREAKADRDDNPEAIRQGNRVSKSVIGASNKGQSRTQPSLPPLFKPDFALNTSSDSGSTYSQSSIEEKEPVSPKSTYGHSGWTSVDRSATPRIVKMPTGAHDKKSVHKRRRSSTPDAALEPAAQATSSSAAEIESESDSEGDLVPSHKNYKYARRSETLKRTHPRPPAEKPARRNKKTTKTCKKTSSRPAPPPPSPTGGNTGVDSTPLSTKFTAADFRAALCLMQLSVEDQRLATGPDGIVHHSKIR